MDSLFKLLFSQFNVKLLDYPKLSRNSVLASRQLPRYYLCLNMNAELGQETGRDRVDMRYEISKTQ